MTLERETFRDEDRRSVEIYAASEHHVNSAPYQFEDGYRPSFPTVNAAGMGNQQGSASSFVDEFEVGSISGVPIYLTGRCIAIYESARKQHLAAYVLAFVSLFVGGVGLSLIALVLALFARKEFLVVSGEQFRDAAQIALRRAGTIVVVVCALALALNIMSLIALAPYIVSMLQSGDISSMVPFFQEPASTTTGGNPIFG